MAVLFLDIDGVLCTPLSVRLDILFRRPMGRQFFDPIALHLLRRPGPGGPGPALFCPLPGGTALRTPTPSSKPSGTISTAPWRPTAPRCGDLAPILGQSKGEEIAAWLDQHPGTSYVILDDRPDEFTRTPALQARLVLVDSMRGLRRADFRQALALLEG